MRYWRPDLDVAELLAPAVVDDGLGRHFEYLGDLGGREEDLRHGD